MSSASKAFVIFAIVLIGLTAWAETQDLWVCADRNNLPYSNDREEGFENKLAQMVAHDLGRSLHYVWWPDSPTLARKMFRRGACDVVMGMPATGDDLAETTLPYYRSSYVFVSRRDHDLAIRSFDDPALRTVKIGVHVMDDGYTPAVQELARRGIINNVVGYTLSGNLAQVNPSANLIRAVAGGDVDVAIAWGPQAGYFAQQYARESKVALKLTPICAATVYSALPLSFDISIGVRKDEDALRERLNQELARRSQEIHELLVSYGIPLTNPSATPGACK